MNRHPTSYQYPFPPIPEGWTEDGKRFAFGLRNLFDILFARSSSWKSADEWTAVKAKSDIQAVLETDGKVGIIQIPYTELTDTVKSFYTSFYDGTTLYKCKADASKESIAITMYAGSTQVTPDVHFIYR